MSTWRSISAIVFPMNCIQSAPVQFSKSTTDCRRQTRLQDIPTEILTIIFFHLTLTSRVNLALTCKLFAVLLSNTPNILSFALSNITPSDISARDFELITDDESFHCYTLVDGLVSSQRLPHPSYELICECCCEKVPRNYQRYLYKHNRAYACAGGRSRMFTVGMFRLMEWGWQLKAFNAYGGTFLTDTEEVTSSGGDDNNQDDLQDDDSQSEDRPESESDAGMEDRTQVKDDFDDDSEKCESV